MEGWPCGPCHAKSLTTKAYVRPVGESLDEDGALDTKRLVVGVSWGYPCVGFGCGEVDIACHIERVRFHRVQLVRALREVARRDKRGVALLATLLTARLVAVSTLMQQGRCDPTRSLSGRENGKR